ncbi:MAG: pectinesterase family protein [Chitinophagaceae bacterium]
MPKKSLLLFSLLLSGLLSFAEKNSLHWKELIVAQDGSGNYTKIQDAINDILAHKYEEVTLRIRNGIYNEKIVVPDAVSHIRFIGDSKERTIITNADYSGKFVDADTVNNKKKYSTSSSYTMYVHANDISIENLTIQNAAGRVGQAVALSVDGDRFRIRNCNILGNQDTLLSNGDGSRQYYEDCFIEGTTDFIFGSATALFKNCTLKCLTNSYITAASTSEHQQFGYVFVNCRLIAAEECKLQYLGRPWRPFAKVVFMNCEMDKHIRPEGWHNWGKKENEATAYYAEYNNTGVGAATDKRVTWSHQLTAEEAKQYSQESIFKDWKPSF